MKLITAIIKAEQLDEVVAALAEYGARGLTATEVRGFGQEFGQFDDTAAGAATLLPKIRLDLVVLDDDAETVTETIAKHAYTGVIGDGKIWVAPVDSVLRVRTGERDRAAI
jgi:nitrogen regulatory protein P-II 1